MEEQQQNTGFQDSSCVVHSIYLHLVDFCGFHVGQHTSPMDGMGTTQTFPGYFKDPM